MIPPTKLLAILICSSLDQLRTTYHSLKESVIWNHLQFWICRATLSSKFTRDDSTQGRIDGDQVDTKNIRF